jgi:hypothetical protein
MYYDLVDDEGVRVRLQEVPYTQLKGWLGDAATGRMQKQWGDLESFSGIGKEKW